MEQTKYLASLLSKNITNFYDKFRKHVIWLAFLIGIFFIINTRIEVINTKPLSDKNIPFTYSQTDTGIWDTYLTRAKIYLERERFSNTPINYSQTDTGIWDTYLTRAKIYLERERFSNTPITAEMLTDCAKEIMNSYSVFIPVEFALAQAQWESGLGTKGRSPKNNPWNLGEYSDKTVIKYSSTREGAMGYYKLIAIRYLNHGKKTVHDLFKNNISDIGGYQYAGSDTYGYRIKKQYYYIINYINKRI